MKGGCVVRTLITTIFVDFFLSAHHELACLASDYDSSNEAVIAKLANMRRLQLSKRGDSYWMYETYTI